MQKINNKTANLVFKILTGFFMFLLAILLTATTILFENKTVVSGALKATTTVVIPDPDADEQDTAYYKSDFKSVAEEQANAFKVSEDVVSEGAVLLENSYDAVSGDYALPLDGESPTVSLFSVSSVNLALSGGGSGGATKVGNVNLKNAMETAGFKVNGDLWNFYVQNESKYTYADARVWTIGDGLSGGIALKNVYSPEVEGEEANKIIFKFASDKTAKVNMGLTMNKANNGTYGHRVVADFYDITVNGKTVSVTGVDVPAENENAAGFVVADVPITIVEGENEIVLQTKAFKINKEGELDCINIKTSATLSGFTPKYLDMSKFKVTVYATNERLGKLTLACPDCGETAQTSLPTLSEGKTSGFYSVSADETYGNVYKLSGTELVAGYDEIPKTAQHKLKIVDDYVTFADGAKEKDVWENYPLPELKVEREGYEVLSWYDMTNVNVTWTADEFSMPEKDLSIKPVWKTTGFCADASVGGKVDLNNGGLKIHTNTVEGFNRTTLMNNLKTCVLTVGENESLYAEQAFEYKYPGGVQTGWTFISCVPCKVDGWTKVNFLMQNKGLNTLTFEAWQISLSTQPTAAGNPHQMLTIEPGQTVEFSLTANLTKNGNILTYYKFLANSADFDLAVIEYVEKGEEQKPEVGDEHNVTILNVDGSKYGVTTTDGATSFSLAANAAMPELTVNTPNGYTLAGYIDADTNEKYVGTFTMIDRDVKLKPYFKPTKNTAETDFGKAVDYSANGAAASIHQNRIKGFVRSTLTSGMTKTIVLLGAGDDKFYSEVVTYSYKGGVQEGWSFIGMTSRKIDANTSYEFTYTFYNFGTETLSFDIYQTNASAKPKEEGNPTANVTIPAGESVTIKLNLTGFKNKNTSIMLYYEFTSATTSDLSLGVNLYMNV